MRGPFKVAAIPVIGVRGSKFSAFRGYGAVGGQLVWPGWVRPMLHPTSPETTMLSI